MKGISILITLLIATFLTSCGNLNSVYRNNKINENTNAVSVDAKQRFLVATTVQDKTFDSNGKLLRETFFPVVCAEPSPDTFSVYTAAIEANASKADQITAALKTATGESGATIGIRSESIQLIRDAMYRLCEAYAANGIEKKDYHALLSKYQKSMVTLIAISQLTGAAAPQQIALSNNASIVLSNRTFEAKENLDKARITLNTLKETALKINDRQKKSLEQLGGEYNDKCPEDKAIDGVEQLLCDEQKSIINEKAINIAETSVAEKNVSEWKLAFENSSDSTRLITQANVEAIKNPPKSLDLATTEALSKSIKELVKLVFNEDVNAMCIESLSKISSQDISLPTESEEMPTRQSELNSKNDASTLMINFCRPFLVAGVGAD